ncbi:hypothetical protein C8F04DRAFT_1406777 [Mycena alexandri]|uniref:Uncharacterized protein n=1 Tax=Mycena alexandri TaxID=1745969 RepID=A0AAD6RWI9_9AGAR|nr:hypothetical protein C8F04DRAFT_1406777 [Mycena alexandri]
MVLKPNSVKYPDENDARVLGYIRLLPGITLDHLSEIKELLRVTNRASAGPLKAIFDGCEMGLPQYDHEELWMYNYWHASDEGGDDRKHCTFRYFADVARPGKTPWNVETFHLYNDGEAISWIYGPPQVDELA